MAYIKYKEITKYFYFSKCLDKTKLPKYVNDYVFDDERMLVAYKTKTDHGVFTTSKIVLFDNYSPFGTKKHIYTIPYRTISTCSIIFHTRTAELSLFLDCGYPVRLRFINLNDVDKLRLRYLYTVIIKVINNQKVSSDEINRLVTDDISIKEGDGK